MTTNQITEAYAEIVEVDFPNHRWAVNAFGDGDFNKHEVQFVPMGNDNEIRTK